MASAMCSCGETVEFEGLDPRAVQVLLGAVRAAKRGVISGEISAAEGLLEIERAMTRAVQELHCGAEHEEAFDDLSGAPGGLYSLPV